MTSPVATVFAAQLIPGVPAEVLGDSEVAHLTTPVNTRRSYSPSDPRRSFILIKGPNAVATATPDGRYLVGLVGQYFTPANNQGPAEWLIRKLEQGPIECLQELNGSWRLIVIDNGNRSAVVATDRMGCHRICYSVGPGGVLTVGHDARVVATIRDAGLTIRADSILHYFYFHCVPSPNTFFHEIQCLAPSTALLWNSRGWLQRRYWVPRFSAGSVRDRTIRPAELLETLEGAIRSISSPERTASFLSGGLDSSTVLGLARMHFPGTVTPYTIGFDEPEYDETRFAQAAAQHFGATLNRYEVTPEDVIDAMSAVSESFDEPFGNSSAIPTYYCARAAVAGGEHTILAGDGGDELFAGNERYRTQQIFGLYHKLPRMLRAGVVEPLFLRTWSSSTLAPIRKIRRYVEQAIVPMPDRLQTYNFLYARGLEDIFTARFLEAIDAESPLRHLREVFAEPDTEDLVDRMLYLDWKLTLGDNDLRKVTVMCERAGIHVKFPMLDNRLIELACRIPGTAKMPRGKLRGFYKTAVRSLLPRVVLQKRKHGFGLPFGPWFARSARLRSQMLGLLDSVGCRDVIRKDYVDAVRRATLGEHPGYYGGMIWLLCVFESWLSARPEWSSYRV